MTSPVIGAKIEKELIVSKEDFAINVGSGSLEVLATPVIVTLMETAANELSNKYLGKGHTTVGIKINIDHIRPSIEGSKVTVCAKLSNVDGRKFVFDVSAYDEKDNIVAKGVHERFIVNIERFMQNANSNN